jgi:addiction module RelE/StbE family toxin
MYTDIGMWEVFEHRRVIRQLKSLPTEILKRYEKWKDIVTISGPQGLRLIRGFNDEALSGEWKSYRSSRLGQQFRVIYRIVGNQVRVEVVNVTAHDYRRK